MIGRHVEREIVAWRDGLLAPRDAARVEQHVRTCDRCRAHLEAVESNEALLRELPAVALTPAERARILAAARAPREHRAYRLAFALAAVIIAIAGIVVLARPRVVLASPTSRPRSIEQAAAEAYARWNRGALRIEHPTASPRAAARHAAARVQVTPALTSNAIVEGETAAGAFSAIAARVGRAPVLLVLADRSRVADAPPRIPGVKRVEVREAGVVRYFTWSAGGDAYTLVVPASVRAADSCALCHAEGATLAQIRSRL